MAELSETELDQYALDLADHIIPHTKAFIAQFFSKAVVYDYLGEIDYPEFSPEQIEYVAGHVIALLLDHNYVLLPDEKYIELKELVNYVITELAITPEYPEFSSISDDQPSIDFVPQSEIGEADDILD